MITKGQIEKIIYENNKLSVRIPLFESTGTNTKTIIDCSVSHEPGVLDGYEVGDVVWVAFENNLIHKPVVIGKLYLDEDKQKLSSYIAGNNLKVSTKAILPSDTTIGGINIQNIMQSYKIVNEYINTKDISINSAQFTTGIQGAGKIFFDDTEGVLQVTLSPNVQMAVGIDQVLKVYNDTEQTLVDGQVVYNAGNINGITKVKLALANDLIQSHSVLGVITEPILSHQYGFLTRCGYVGNILLKDSDFNIGQEIYLSSSIPGSFSTQKPTAPNYVTQIGYVNKLSSNDTTTDGQIYVDINIIPIASDISYDNENGDTGLSSQTVKSAIDELELKKADIDLLTRDITLYRTITNADVTNYKKLVTSISDPAYPNPEVAVSTGAITTSNQLLVSTIADAGLYIGNPGALNITSIAQIRKSSGNNNQNAKFYFEIYKRTASNVETLLGTSNLSNTVTETTFYEFTVTCLVSPTSFGETDRIVVKSYASVEGIAGGVFEFKYGGNTPFRLLLPVPVSVIPTPKAKAVITDITSFNNILSWQDTNVQHSLETLNIHKHSGNDINSGAVPVIYGGTGITTYTQGDILYCNGTNSLSKLAKGSNNQLLTIVSGVPAWSAYKGPTETNLTSRISTQGDGTQSISSSIDNYNEIILELFFDQDGTGIDVHVCRISVPVNRFASVGVGYSGAFISGPTSLLGTTTGMAFVSRGNSAGTSLSIKFKGTASDTWGISVIGKKY